MRFIDDKILLTIKSKQVGSGRDVIPAKIFSFKAYMEKSDIQIKIMEENMQYVPLGYTNNSLFSKLQYVVDLSFNVFSETREEAISNYDLVHDMFSLIKPTYRYVGNQPVPDDTNIFGSLSVIFKGLPRLKTNISAGEDPDELDLFVTNFGYSINKDMGYIQVPYTPKQKQDSYDRTLLQKDGLGMLVPIAFKIDLAGRVLLDIKNANRIIGPGPVSGVRADEPPKLSVYELGASVKASEGVVNSTSALYPQLGLGTDQDIQKAITLVNSVANGGNYEYYANINGAYQPILDKNGNLRTSRNTDEQARIQTKYQLLKATVERTAKGE